MSRALEGRRPVFLRKAIFARTLFILAACLGVARRAPAEESPEGPVYSIRRIVIHSGNIFDQGDANPIFRLVNGLHITTRKEIIRREVLLQPGDPYDQELVEESERNIRALDFISEANIEPIFLPDRTAILHVYTRDRFSLRAEAGADFIGGASKFRMSLGENNLFGWGKSGRVTIIKKEDERIQRFSYDDPRLFGTRHKLDTDLAFNSEEGNRFQIELARPFFSLETRWSWGTSFRLEKSKADFFEGSTETSLDQRIIESSSFITRAFGDRHFRKFLGADLGLTWRDYGRIEGPRAAEITIPNDFRSFTITPRAGVERNIQFQKRQYLDALGAIEDVVIGWSGTVSAGPEYRERDGGPDRVNTVLGASASYVRDIGKDHLAVVSGLFSSRVNGGDARGWSGAALYHHYYQGLKLPKTVPHTLALSAVFDAVYEGEGLLREIYLGEESGLRGYDVREFRGQKRVRLNLEDRIALPWEVFSARFGIALFADAGYVWPRGESVAFDDLRTSAGLGLRVGSIPILGDRVVRIDVAFPLGEDSRGRRGGVTVSATVGQIFSLLSNPEQFASDF